MPFYTFQELSLDPTFNQLRYGIYQGSLSQTFQFLIGYASLSIQERSYLLNRLAFSERLPQPYLDTLVYDIRWSNVFAGMQFEPFYFQMPFNMHDAPSFLAQVRLNCPYLHQLLCQEQCQIIPDNRQIIYGASLPLQPQLITIPAPQPPMVGRWRQVPPMHYHGHAQSRHSMFGTPAVMPPQFSNAAYHCHPEQTNRAPQPALHLHTPGIHGMYSPASAPYEPPRFSRQTNQHGHPAGYDAPRFGPGR